MFRVVILIMMPLGLSAQVFNAAPHLGMGNTGTAHSGVYSLSSNPAGIGTLRSLTAAIAYQQHYIGADIQSMASYVASPIGSRSFIGAGFLSYGIPQVSKLNKYGGSFVKKIGENIRSSLSLNYHSYHVQGFVSDGSVSGDLGIQILLNDDIHLGAFFKNISRSTFSEYVDQNIPQELNTGLLYRFSSELTFAFDTGYDFYVNSTNYKCGIEYSVMRRLFFRGGVESRPLQYFLGLGFAANKIMFDLASAYHPQLGHSPQMALCYAFN